MSINFLNTSDCITLGKNNDACTLPVGTAFCHVGHTVTHLIIEVKQRCARLVLEWVTTQMASMPGPVLLNGVPDS
jgi:hypothetical protein